MMKKLIYLLAIGAVFHVKAQCNITGSNTIKVGELAQYTVENDNAQCADCHQWTTGTNIKIDGEHRKATVAVKAQNTGRAVVSLAMLTPNGFSQCSKSIDVIDGTNASTNTAQTNNCDIAITEFKELKYSDGLAIFIPASTDNSYRFIWTATYANGEQKEITDRTPQFGYSKDNGITSMKVKIISNKCIKTLTKNYDSNFWKFF